MRSLAEFGRGANLRTEFWLGPVAVVLAAALQGGQTQPVTAEQDLNISFDAASVKPSEFSDGIVLRFTVEPNRLDIQNMNLKFLIMQAYDLRDDQVSAPDSLFDHIYDVAATTGEPVSRATMRAMLRNLLVERFHLTTHWEPRTSAIYRLVVLPGGPKMKKMEQRYAVPDSPTTDRALKWINGPMSMAQLAESLARLVRKPVIDATAWTAISLSN
jgi:uncharacterized protein (TIGR03435 family)